MNEQPRRIDGWKAIASHFGRNRSTVLRWAEGGDFPVRRVAGRRGASVWAYAHELDAWLVGAEGDRTSQAPLNVAAAQIESKRAPRVENRFVMIAVLVALCAGGVATAVFLTRRAARAPPRASRLPTDTGLADRYLQARDDWSTRTPAGLRKSIAEFASVTAGDPTFAPAYAGLADAYIASREYDSVPDAVAFPKAEAAAKAALAVDPDSADANRALGFVAYWWRHDMSGAQTRFDRALTAEPNNAQTHFWLGNILSHAGEGEASLRELRTARLLDPGSRAIQMDYAWAQWVELSGNHGVADLEALANSSPPMSSAHKYLSLIALAKGDVAGYLIEAEKRVAIQGGDALRRGIAAQRAAYESGGPKAALALIAQTLNDTDAAPWITIWRGTALSLLGRRSELLALMAREGIPAGDWITWHPDQWRFAKWRGDRAVWNGLENLSGHPTRVG
jgi:tetratricopeptide (TPR) repeat protein